MEAKEITIEKLDLSLSVMRIIKPACVRRIQDSMHLHGQLQPVVVRSCEERYQVIDGFKRVYAALELMKETLECYVLDVDVKQAKLLVLSYNRSHQSMEVWEEAMVLDDLSKRHNLNQHSLSKLTGYSRCWVSRRLSLINRIDEQVVSEIKMGVINSSQARALIRLPRGNQMEVARVITSWNLPSRLSNTLVDAFLSAENEQQQQYLLTHPQVLLSESEPENPCDVNDPRLGRYGNDLIKSMQYVLSTISHLLSRMQQERFNTLKETEKIIITPEIKQVQAHAKSLIKAITQLQTHKAVSQNER
jgi:ParB family transcriptional regulator, chromosome partitioning protein